MTGIHSFSNYFSNDQPPHPMTSRSGFSIDVFSPVRRWLNQLDIHNATLAHSICRVIPAQCPFARTVAWQGRTLLVIPPLCKLNPVYEELMELRFRALCYLADQDQDHGCDRPISAHTTHPC